MKLRGILIPRAFRAHWTTCDKRGNIANKKTLENTAEKPVKNENFCCFRELAVNLGFLLGSPGEGKREIQEFLEAPNASPEEKLKLARATHGRQIVEFYPTHS